jgi:hypothetical protein
VFVCMIAAALAALALFELQRRLSQAEADTETALKRNTQDGLSFAVRDFCQRTLESDLLPDATEAGLAPIPLRFRLHSDPYSRVGELLNAFDTKSESTSYSDLVQLVRLFYQLEYSLRAGPDAGANVLSILERRLTANDGNKPVGSVSRVHRGQRFDGQTMTYLRNGTHVEQPFGFVVYSPDKKLIGKADVLCR